jgi:hypothetical protein
MKGFLNKPDKGTGGIYDDVDEKSAKERVVQREEAASTESSPRVVEETEEMKQREREQLTQLYSEFEKQQRKESTCSKICEKVSLFFASLTGQKKAYVPLNASNKKED